MDKIVNPFPSDTFAADKFWKHCGKWWNCSSQAIFNELFSFAKMFSTRQACNSYSIVIHVCVHTFKKIFNILDHKFSKSSAADLLYVEKGYYMPGTFMADIFDFIEIIKHRKKASCDEGSSTFNLFSISWNSDAPICLMFVYWLFLINCQINILNKYNFKYIKS